MLRRPRCTVSMLNTAFTQKQKRQTHTVVSAVFQRVSTGIIIKLKQTTLHTPITFFERRKDSRRMYAVAIDLAVKKLRNIIFCGSVIRSMLFTHSITILAVFIPVCRAKDGHTLAKYEYFVVALFAQCLLIRLLYWQCLSQYICSRKDRHISIGHISTFRHRAPHKTGEYIRRVSAT